MAQHTPAQLGAKRVPMMSASMLEDRTRPLGKEPTPIWLQHRLQRRHGEAESSAARRARDWFGRLVRRSPDA